MAAAEVSSTEREEENFANTSRPSELHQNAGEARRSNLSLLELQCFQEKLNPDGIQFPRQLNFGKT